MRKRWIFGGIGLAVLLGAAYTGYWFWLAQTFQQNLLLWVDQQRAMGYRMSYTASEPSGYPLPVRIALTDVAVEPPPGLGPWRFNAASMRLSLPPWNPLMLHIGGGEEASTSHLQWDANGRRFDLSGAGIETIIELSAQEEPPTITIDAAHIELKESDQPYADIWKLQGQVELKQVRAPADSSVEFSLEAQQIDLLADLPSPDGRLKEVYSPGLKGQFIGAVPGGRLRDALAEWSRQGGYLNITDVSAEPSGGFPPRFEGSASIALDAQLQPIVAASVTVRDYGRAVDRAVADGIMTPAQGTAAQLWLSAKAEKDERGLKVTLPLTIQDGFVSMGPIKLAQVPRIAWE